MTLLRERLNYRALSLATMASRHFVRGEPHLAVQVCNLLAETGTYLQKTAHDSASSTMDLPWERLLTSAVQCQGRIRNHTLDIGNLTLPPESLASAGDHGAIRRSSSSSVSVLPVVLPCNVVYAVLAAMSRFTLPHYHVDRLYELLATALVRRIVFVTGAVSMAGCPTPDRGEACFIGRSNVGKSSLVNMITSRKALAYTSKRPGKTQQFNYFAVNDVPGLERTIQYGDIVPGRRDADSFYIVDLPGFGYAKVPEQQRQTWLSFMHEYLAQRESLRVVFHLIDSRHGPTEDDAIIMKQVADTLEPKASSTSPSRRVSYVVVLTKADKNVKGGGTADNKKRQGRTGHVSKSVLAAVHETMRTCGVEHAPVVLSSAETKLGRDVLWRYLRLAAEPTP